MNVPVVFQRLRSEPNPTRQRQRLGRGSCFIPPIWRVRSRNDWFSMLIESSVDSEEFAIVSDNLALQCINSQPSNLDCLTNASDVYHSWVLLVEKSNSRLARVPWHTGIEGDETADALAKQAFVIPELHTYRFVGFTFMNWFTFE